MGRISLAAAALCLAGNVLASEAGDLFALKCGPCHQKDGKGSAYGKKLGVPDLTATTLSEAEIVQVISNGKGKMSGYTSRLTLDEIQAVAKYVKNGLK